MSAPSIVPSPLVLVGFMGCGKSTVGHILAQQLGWHFCDLDRRIESAAGVSIASIFAQRGEAVYRQLEHIELVQALGATQERRTVLALGGGTFVQPPNLELIRRSPGISVFIEVPLEELLLRCAAMTNRPLFRDEASFRELYAHRLGFYRQAQVTVEGGGRSPSKVAEGILAACSPTSA